MFCREFGVKTVEFQAECQAVPDILPGVWGQNSRIPGGMPGGAGCFAGSSRPRETRDLSTTEKKTAEPKAGPAVVNSGI